MVEQNKRDGESAANRRITKTDPDATPPLIDLRTPKRDEEELQAEVDRLLDDLTPCGNGAPPNEKGLGQLQRLIGKDDRFKRIQDN